MITQPTKHTPFKHTIKQLHPPKHKKTPAKPKPHINRNKKHQETQQRGIQTTRKTNQLIILITKIRKMHTRQRLKIYPHIRRSTMLTLTLQKMTNLMPQTTNREPKKKKNRYINQKHIRAQLKNLLLQSMFNPSNPTTLLFTFIIILLIITTIKTTIHTRSLNSIQPIITIMQ